MSNATYADSESESFERICFAEKVYLVTVVALELLNVNLSLQDTFFVGAGSSLREYENNHTEELHGKHKKYLGKRKS